MGLEFFPPSYLPSASFSYVRIVERAVGHLRSVMGERIVAEIVKNFTNVFDTIGGIADHEFNALWQVDGPHGLSWKTPGRGLFHFFR